MNELRNKDVQRVVREGLVRGHSWSIRARGEQAISTILRGSAAGCDLGSRCAQIARRLCRCGQPSYRRIGVVRRDYTFCGPRDQKTSHSSSASVQLGLTPRRWSCRTSPLCVAPGCAATRSGRKGDCCIRKLRWLLGDSRSRCPRELAPGRLQTGSRPTPSRQTPAPPADCALTWGIYLVPLRSQLDFPF